MSGDFPCCEHCPEDPVHDVPLDEHEVPCTLCNPDPEVAGLRAELARATDYQAAITSFVAAVRQDVVLIRQRDEARARLEAVRALCDGWQEGGRVTAFISGGHIDSNKFVSVADIRAALEPQETPLEPPPRPVAPAGTVPGTQVTPDSPSALRSPPTEGAP